jgi:hypothetical protein
MPTISIPGRRLAALLFLVTLVGCTDGNTTADTRPRKAVTGTVTLDGQPLPQGTITFDPVERKPGTTIAVADVKDGKFAIDRGFGPVPDKYKILISSRTATKLNPGEPLPKPEPEKVPAQFNSKSTLTKEITDQSVNTVDFDLKSS